VIAQGSKVSIHYTLRVDGEVIDSSDGQEPLEYEQGSGQIIPGLENALVGLTAGATRDVVVAPEHGYGLVNPDAIQTVPKSAFETTEGLQVDGVIAGETSDGRRFQARVADIGIETVTLDLNHPLAGKTLLFSVEIVSVS
jgi:FKBP-type peptidyl-prolyl cis-trans isomerase 2